MFFWVELETKRNRATLAHMMMKKGSVLRVMAKAQMERANPQYQDSTLKPLDQLGRPPAAGTRGVREGQRRGTAWRKAA